MHSASSRIASSLRQACSGEGSPERGLCSRTTLMRLMNELSTHLQSDGITEHKNHDSLRTLMVSQRVTEERLTNLIRRTLTLRNNVGYDRTIRK